MAQFTYSTDKYLRDIYIGEREIVDRTGIEMDNAILTIRRSNFDYGQSALGEISCTTPTSGLVVAPQAKAKEVTDITCRADSSSDLQDTMFMISQPVWKKQWGIENTFDWYYGWYNVDAGGADPGPGTTKGSQKWGFSTSKTEGSATGLSSSTFYSFTVTFDGTDYEVELYGGVAQTYTALMSVITYNIGSGEYAPIPREVDVVWDDTGNGFLKFEHKIGGKGYDVTITDGFPTKTPMFAALANVNGSAETAVDGAGPVGLNCTGIEIAISADDTDDDVAIATTSAIDGTSGFGASRSGEVVTVTCDDYGECMIGQDIDVGGVFDITRDTEGIDEYFVYIGSRYTNDYSSYHNIVVTQLASCTMTGERIEIGTGDGSSGQKFDFYWNNYPNFCWVETGSGTGIYRIFTTIGNEDLDGAESEVNVGAGEELGCFFRWDSGNQQIEFGDGTNGDVVPNGAKVEIPNVYFDTYLDYPDSSHKYLEMNPGPAGEWTLEKVMFSNKVFFESIAAKSMSFIDVGTSGNTILSTCSDVYIRGLYTSIDSEFGSVSRHGITMMYLKFVDDYAEDLKICGKGYYGAVLTRLTGPTEFKDMRIYLFDRGSGSYGAPQADNIVNITFTDFVSVGSAFTLTDFESCVFDGIKYSNTTNGVLRTSLSSNMFGLTRIKGCSFSDIYPTENGTPCYGYVLSITDVPNTIFQNWQMLGQNHANRFMYPRPSMDNFAVIGGDLGEQRGYFAVTPAATIYKMRVANLLGDISNAQGSSARYSSWQGIPSGSVSSAGAGCEDVSIAQIYTTPTGRDAELGMIFAPENELEYFEILNGVPYYNYAGYLKFQEVSDQCTLLSHFKILGTLGLRNINIVEDYVTNCHIDYRYKINAGSFNNYKPVSQVGASPAGQIHFNDNPTVTCLAASSLQSKYFLIDSLDDEYYVWFDVDSGGADPTVGTRTGIEVDLAGADTPAQVAVKLATVMDNEGDFTAPFSTMFEISYILCVADVAKSLNSTYFTFSKVGTDYYVWYDVDSTGSNPTPGGTGIEVDISEDDDAEAVALATRDAIDGTAGFTATHLWKEVLIENDADGPVTDAADGDAGVTVTIGQQGYTDRVPIGQSMNLVDGDSGCGIINPLVDGDENAREDGMYLEYRMTLFGSPGSNPEYRWIRLSTYNDPEILYPGILKTVTLTNVVVDSRWIILKESTQDELARGVAASSTVSVDLEYPGAPFDIRIRVRNASSSPKYETYESLASFTGDGANVYVSQQSDE